MPPGKRPRRFRNYKAEYARRQAKARKLGYAGYYQRRVRRGAPPSASAPTGQALRRARGHAASRDLAAEARPGWFLTAIPLERDRGGRITRVRIDAIDDAGVEREYWLSGKQLTRPELERLVDSLGPGMRFAPKYDLRRLAGGEPSGIDELDEAA